MSDSKQPKATKYDPPAISLRAYNPDAKSFYEGVEWEIIAGEVAARVNGDLVGIDLYTQQIDHLGNKIFTNDILLLGDVKTYTAQDGSRQEFKPVAPPDTRLWVVFKDGQFNTKEGTIHELAQWHKLEVIGNVHENEL